MRKSARGFGFYIISILLILLLATYISDMMKRDGDSYGLNEYYSDLEAGKIAKVFVYPNEETPTGEIRVQLIEGDLKIFQVTDVEDVESAA